jgi:hypothetical protein
MENLLRNFSSAQLKRALQIREQIEVLEQELGNLGGAEQPLKKRRSKLVKRIKTTTSSNEAPKKKRVMSASAKAKIAAAQKARWARFHAAKGK